MSKDNRYEFLRNMSFEVLNNYLSRAVNYKINIYNDEQFKEDIRFLTNIGAKYVQRAIGEWYPSNNIENNIEKLKVRLATAHEIDYDIIFEAAIFECVTPDVNNIAIPSWVFEAFGLPVETRNFDVDKMYSPDNYGKDYWKESDHAHLPSICMTEFQMFVYCRAASFIDIGFEALHLGQTLKTGEFDNNFECWTKVITMIRDYAKENSRRGYVIINSHDNGKLKHAVTGHYLVDVIMAPMRAHASKCDVDHMPSEENPQRCIIEKGWWEDSPYQAGYSGVAPYGEKVDKYPYLVEFDNYGGIVGKVGIANNFVWGLDENSWYCNQPRWYRKEFTKYLLDTLDSFEENGHLSILGHRGGFINIITGKSEVFYANNSKFMLDGRDDEQWIKEILQSR